MSQAIVLDAAGQRLSPCAVEKARRMLADGKAKLFASTPLTIQLPYAVPPLPARRPRIQLPAGQGRQLLLHMCCGPCSTYTLARLREQGFAVSGLWYNPNIHPFSEHETRRACVHEFADRTGLQMIWEPYDMPAYFRLVAGHEAFGHRCALCYRMRLERTAQVAHERGLDAFTTTLLISPYQQQATITQIGVDLAREYGGEFYFENFRQGWSQRGKLAASQRMYQQQYCGCVYSAWEAEDRSAATGRKRT